MITIFRAAVVDSVNNDDIAATDDIIIVGNFIAASNRNIFVAGGQLNQADTRFFTITQAGYTELVGKLQNIIDNDGVVTIG